MSRTVSPPAIRIESLPAGYGDSLLVSCPVGRRTWRLLVDTGPDECWPQLRNRLAQIPLNALGRRHIDLVVISHIDHDHIGGAGLLFSSQAGALQVDAFKLNRHGSRANVTQDLLAAVQADHYLVSTNGALFQHPNDEAIARVILNGGSRPTIWFNYFNERTQRWADPALLERYGYQVGVPSDTVGGVVLELAAAR